jgi:hypothetical protein
MRAIFFKPTSKARFGNLLDHNRSKALVQIENARNGAMKNVKAFGSDVVPMEQEAKSLRLAIGLLEKTFDRLCEIYSSSKGDDTSLR